MRWENSAGVSPGPSIHHVPGRSTELARDEMFSPSQRMRDEKKTLGCDTGRSCRFDGGFVLFPFLEVVNLGMKRCFGAVVWP